MTYLEFVRPALLKMKGYKEFFLKEIEAFLEQAKQKKPERTHFLRGIFREKDGTVSVRSAGEQNSHILESFSRANCLFCLEKDKTDFERGSKVKIQLLPWE